MKHDRRPYIRPCEECNRPRVALTSGAGYVCPRGHGQIVQAEPEQATLAGLAPAASLPFEEPADPYTIGRFETGDGVQWSIKIP